MAQIYISPEPVGPGDELGAIVNGRLEVDFLEAVFGVSGFCLSKFALELCVLLAVEGLGDRASDHELEQAATSGFDVVDRGSISLVSGSGGAGLFFPGGDDRRFPGGEESGLRPHAREQVDEGLVHQLALDSPFLPLWMVVGIALGTPSGPAGGERLTGVGIADEMAEGKLVSI